MGFAYKRVMALPRDAVLLLLIGQVIHLLDLRLFSWGIVTDICGTVFLLLGLMRLAPHNQDFERAKIVGGVLLVCGLFEMVAAGLFHVSIPAVILAQSTAVHLMLLYYVFEGMLPFAAARDNQTRVQLTLFRGVYALCAIASFGIAALFPAAFPLAIAFSSIASLSACVGLFVAFAACPA